MVWSSARTIVAGDELSAGVSRCARRYRAPTVRACELVGFLRTPLMENA
jgi:hypothetical protein